MTFSLDDRGYHIREVGLDGLASLRLALRSLSVALAEMIHSVFK
jgi:hypothetical protein